MESKNIQKIKFKSTGLLTKLSVHDIEQSLITYFGGIRSKNFFVPNISWGMFDYEMDFLVITPSLFMKEIEIKRSWSDFKADFKKTFIHNDKRVKEFFYCVPEVMKDKVAEYCTEDTGILCYSEDGGIYRGRAAKSKNAQKLNNDDLIKLTRLSTIRFWMHRDDGDKKLKEELIKVKGLLTEVKIDYKKATGKKWELD